MPDTGPDIRQIAETYRKALKLKLAEIEEFLATAERLSGDPDGRRTLTVLTDEARDTAWANVVYLSAHRRSASG